jgi:hypothetical protein
MPGLRRNARDAITEVELESMTGKRKGGVAPLVTMAPQDLRSDFVRKVYGILATQLLITLMVAGTFVSHGDHWLKASPSFVIGAVTLSSAASLFIALIYSCCPEVTRQSPQNYALLAVFTVAESILVGFTCLRYTAGSVLLCLGITFVIMVGLSLYATYTKSDFTTHGSFLFSALMALIGVGFSMWLISAFGLGGGELFNAVQVLYAAGGAVLFSFFLIYDTQKIMGGNHQHEFSIDDYTMAAICLYLDVLNLFLSLLQLLGRESHGDGL